GGKQQRHRQKAVDREGIRVEAALGGELADVAGELGKARLVDAAQRHDGDGGEQGSQGKHAGQQQTAHHSPPSGTFYRGEDNSKVPHCRPAKTPYFDRLIDIVPACRSLRSSLDPFERAPRTKPL